MQSDVIHIIGGGLAGSEAAWQAAQAGAQVLLHEMRPEVSTPAHQTDRLAELVCSNSFRADDATQNAVGLLHEEMRRLGSLVMASADEARTPAGAALAVDRDLFSQAVTDALAAHPRVTLVRGEIPYPPADWSNVIVATGPLTSPALAQEVRVRSGADSLAFFDAIAPIVHLDSIDMEIAWRQSRYDKAGPGGDGADYINCPMDRETYERFVAALVAAPKTEFRPWEDAPYFEGCLPIEVMAERGPETLRHGPMKPFGLTNPRAPERKPYAVVQLRQDNRLGTLWNMVGFQTKMKHAAQVEIFRTIPALEKAVFARLGGVHRNTFLNSPQVLDGALRLKADPRLRFAGQVTGVEGYVESAAMGLLAGRMAAAQSRNEAFAPPPPTTALGALLAHVTGGALTGAGHAFQPMNINFGLFPPLADDEAPAKGPRRQRGQRGRDRKAALSARALRDLDAWRSDLNLAA